MKTWEKIMIYCILPFAIIWHYGKKSAKYAERKSKPALAMLMAVVMLCGMMPMTALAANATTIKVAGTELTETGYYTVSSGTVGSKQDTEPAGGNGYVHWDAANHTLTLYGVTVDGGSTSSGIFANGDYTIKLAEGTNNTVQSSYTNAITCDSGSVTIEGPGAMTATGATNGIKAQYSVVIKANVTVMGNNGCGIVNSPSLFSRNEDPVRIAADVTVSITGSTYGICVNGGYGASPVIDSPNVTIKGGTAAFSVFPYGAPKLSEDIGASAGEDESTLAAYDSASYSTYKCVKTRELAVYTVSFDSNGGSGSMGSAAATEGKDYTLPDCTFTAPSNKTFKAWSVGGEEKQPGDKITVSADTTVTAVWQEVVVYGVYVGDEQFTSANLVINGNDGGTATYDPDTNTLTLNNFKYSGKKGLLSDYYNYSNIGHTWNIVLVGENSITTQDSCVMSTAADIIIKNGSDAAASLTVVATDNYKIGIGAGGDLTVSGVTLDVTANRWGISFMNLVVDADSVIIAKSNPALDVCSSVTLAASSVVFAGDDADSAVLVDTPTDATYADNKYVKIMPSYNVTVSFDANSGAGTMADAAVAVGQEYTLPECGFTAPAGKRFKAWCANGSEKQPGDKVVFMEDAAVTVIWEDIPHTCSIEPVEKVWPDCENGGKEAYYKCEGCGKFFEDANGTTEIANIETWGNLPKNGHTESDWKSDKDNHWKECACGDKANTAAHKDENADGKCDVCAYNIGLPTTPDDGNKPSDNPQTGDNTQLGLWIALLIVSSFGIVAITLFGKKKYSVR